MKAAAAAANFFTAARHHVRKGRELGNERRGI
jgi:hypothetical protein